MEISFLDKLSSRNSEYLKVVENKSKLVYGYSEFEDLPEFYEEITIILFDQESHPNEIIRLWGDAVNLGISPTPRARPYSFKET